MLLSTVQLLQNNLFEKDYNTMQKLTLINLLISIYFLQTLSFIYKKLPQENIVFLNRTGCNGTTLMIKQVQ